MDSDTHFCLFHKIVWYAHMGIGRAMAVQVQAIWAGPILEAPHRQHLMVLGTLNLKP